MNYDADIGVVGGGPVGLGTAILARRAGFEVIVWEPREGDVDKACGEGLMPSALAALESLGVDVPEGYPLVGVRYIDAERPDVRPSGSFESPGRGVRRLELHRALRERAEEVGVRIVGARVEGFEEDADGVQVAGMRVRWLVGADGLHSTVRRQAGFDLPRRSERFGVRRHYAIEPWSDRVEVFWAEGAEAYVTPVAHDTVGVAILFEPPGRFDELMEKFPELEGRLEGVAHASEDRGAGPFGARSSTKQRGRILLVGDAAGYVDALTGEGIAIGIESAKQLVDLLQAGRPEDYERAYTRSTRVWRWATRGLVSLTRSRRLAPYMLLFLNAFPRVMDRALVILGGSGPAEERTIVSSEASGRSATRFREGARHREAR